MKRDFTFIDDIISGTRAAMERNYQYEIFNLGNHRSENLMEMINLIERELGREAVIEFQDMQAGDIPESFADIGHSQQYLGFEPITPIKEGIPLFIKWFKAFNGVH